MRILGRLRWTKGAAQRSQEGARARARTGSVRKAAWEREARSVGQTLKRASRAHTHTRTTHRRKNLALWDTTRVVKITSSSTYVRTIDLSYVSLHSLSPVSLARKCSVHLEGRLSLLQAGRVGDGTALRPLSSRPTPSARARDARRLSPSGGQPVSRCRAEPANRGIRQQPALWRRACGCAFRPGPLVFLSHYTGGDAQDLTLNLLTLFSLEPLDTGAVCNDGALRGRCRSLLRCPPPCRTPPIAH